MMPIKDLLRLFRAPTWTDGTSLNAFVASVGDLAAGDLLKLLPLLSERSLVAEGVPHRARCLAFVALCERTPYPELFVPIIRALPGADPTLRAQLVTLLPKVNNPAEHPELCRLLTSEDSDLRKLGAHVLKQVGGKTAFNVLSTYLKDPSFPGRMEALEALVPKAAHHAIPILEDSLRLGRFPEKMLVIKYLGDTKLMAKALPEVARVLANALRDEDERIGAQAAMALAQVTTEDHYLEAMGDLLNSTNPIMVKAIVEGVRRFPSRRMVDILTRRLRIGPNSIRIMVLESLEAIGTEDVLSPVVDALSHPNLQIRSRAAQVL
ncbi:MAG: HEAT repeat domain-containing protein, partial [Myxococcales bacterium]|nr:HEAT repeat domain-containing protein [Myxococcales bacterium]